MEANPHHSGVHFSIIGIYIFVDSVYLYKPMCYYIYIYIYVYINIYVGFFCLLFPQLLSSSTHIALCLPDSFTRIATEGRGLPPSSFGGREVSFLLFLACCHRARLLPFLPFICLFRQLGLRSCVALAAFLGTGRPAHSRVNIAGKSLKTFHH